MTSLSNPLLSLKLLLLLSVLILFIAPTHVHSKRTTNDLVRTTCKETPDPAICEAELRADPRSSDADAEGLILIMIDKVKSRFLDSLRYIESLTEKTRDPEVIRAIRYCIRVYKVVVDTNVVVATNAVRQGDPKFGEQAMVDSGNEAEACKAAFPEGKMPAPVPGRTKVLHGVSNVAASMIKTME